MAKVLIATFPATGHVNPLLGIARALVLHGHEVLWFTSERHADKVAGTGARFAGHKRTPDFDTSALLDGHPERDKLRGPALVNHDIKYAFVQPIPAQVADVEDVLATFPADVILTDNAFAGAWVVSRRLGIPWISVGIMPLMVSSRDTAPGGLGMLPDASPLGRLRNRALGWLAQNVILRDAHRYTQEVTDGLGMGKLPCFVMEIGIRQPDVFLQGTVPSFEYPRSDLPANVRFVGPLLPPAARDFQLPAWWPELSSGKPVVHVTQGTVDNRDLNRLLVPTLQALAHEDVLVVATTGGRPVSDLGIPVPTNARVEEFIPHDALLPHVDVMVTNAGYGGVQRALSDGVPLVVAGDTEDKPEVCQRVAWSGVGINLRTGSPTSAKVGAAVMEVLSNPRYKARALALQAELSMYDSALEACKAVDELAGAPARREETAAA